jgi:ATP/ADP translocase
MNTNGLTWLSDGINVAGAVVNQIQSWPTAVLLSVCLVILNMTLRAMRLFPNRYVPPTIMLVGVVMYYITGDPGKVPAEQVNPGFILGMRGLVVSFGSIIFYTLVIKRWEQKFPIFQINGDTQFIPNERQMSRPDIGLDQPPDNNKPKQ